MLETAQMHKKLYEDNQLPRNLIISLGFIVDVYGLSRLDDTKYGQINGYMH